MGKGGHFVRGTHQICMIESDLTLVWPLRAPIEKRSKGMLRPESCHTEEQLSDDGL